MFNLNYIEMREYVCRCETAPQWQKMLRTWKHSYDIEIISMSATNETTTILLIREEREPLELPPIG